MGTYIFAICEILALDGFGGWDGSRGSEDHKADESNDASELHVRGCFLSDVDRMSVLRIEKLRRTGLFIHVVLPSLLSTPDGKVTSPKCCTLCPPLLFDAYLDQAPIVR